MLYFLGAGVFWDLSDFGKYSRAGNSFGNQDCGSRIAGFIVGNLVFAKDLGKKLRVVSEGLVWGGCCRVLYWEDVGNCRVLT